MNYARDTENPLPPRQRRGILPMNYARDTENPLPPRQRRGILPMNYARFWNET